VGSTPTRPSKPMTNSIIIPAGTPTAAIQDAFDNNLNINFASGIHIFNRPIKVRSGTSVTGSGAIITESAAPDYFIADPVPGLYGWSVLFTNKNWKSDKIIDSNISFENLSFQGLTPMHDIKGIMVRSIDGLTVKGCIFYNMGDAVGSMNSRNIFIDGCHDVDSTNASYDFWESPQDCLVQNCVSLRTPVCVQYNSVGSMKDGAFLSVGYAGAGKNLVGRNNIITLSSTGLGPSAHPMGCSATPLLGYSTLENVSFLTNDITASTNQNCRGISVRGVTGFRIAGNIIRHVVSNQKNACAIAVLADGSVQPTGGTIVNNEFVNCDLTNGSLMRIIGRQTVKGNKNSSSRTAAILRNY
jgi:hypothetical protein